MLFLVTPPCNQPERPKKRRYKIASNSLPSRPNTSYPNLRMRDRILAFTNGSAKQHPKVGWVAGYGCVVRGDWETKGFLPPNSAQTNNRVELLAVITVLEHLLLQTVPLAVVMDSQYVYDGLRGSAFRWRTAGWVGQLGPVCNVNLWITALDLVDRVSATVEWLRVPSHTDIPGNERVDVLAEEGRVSSPLYHVLSLLDSPVVTFELPLPPRQEVPQRSHAPLSVTMSSLPRETRLPYGILHMSTTIMRCHRSLDVSIFQSHRPPWLAHKIKYHHVQSI